MSNGGQNGGGQGIVSGNFLFDLIKIPIVVIGLGVAIGVLYWLGPIHRWAYVAVAMLAVLLVAGRYGTTIGKQQRKWLAALIDPQRGKYSLGQLQLVGWTILVLSAWLAIVSTRIILEVPSGQGIQDSITTISELQQALDRSTSDEEKQDLERKIAEETQKLDQILAADATFEDALNVNIPGDILILLGISATSVVAGTAIKSEKAKADRPNGVSLDVANVVDLREHKAVELSWADIFKGDQVGDKDYIDMGNFQMFWFTVAALVAYGMQIYASIDAATASETLKIFVAPEYLMKAGFSLMTSLPAVSPSLVGLLGISHVAYLANKVPERR